MPRSPLHAVHEEFGARFVDFAGWEMPVQYEGVIAEHLAVRRSCGVFDVSHLGRFSLTGAGAGDLLRHLLCNDATSVEPGRAQYTMALNDSGGVIDDIIIWRRGEDDYLVLPNGANFADIVARFRADAPQSVSIEDTQVTTALLAVQGPDAAAVLEQSIGTIPGRFRVTETSFEGHSLGMAGTGYTGERGAEVAAPLPVAESLLRRLLEAGAVPCGLGARDTLRLEMGYPLWGQDLDEATSPLEAGLEWVVDWDHDFVGKVALLEQRADGLSKQLVAFAMEGRQIARHGYPMRAGSSEGEVSSGNYSPILEHGIGMGFLTPPAPDAGQIEIEIRGKWTPANVVSTPFVARN